MREILKKEVKNMLKHTRAALRKIMKDFRILGWCLDWGVHLLMGAYLVVALILGWGNFIANIVLLTLTVGLLIVQGVERRKNVKWYDKWEEEKKQKHHRHLFQIFILLTKLFSLGVTLYGMAVSEKATSSLLTVLTTLLIILWFVSALVEVITLFAERDGELLMDGIYEDFDWFFQAAKKADEAKENAKGLFGRVFRKEPEENGKKGE